MKTTREDVSAVRKKVTVEVPAADVDTVFDRLVREHRRRLRLPGFRPGKAPLELVRTKLGPELGREARDEILRTFTREAVLREGLSPVEGGIWVELEEGQQELAPAVEGRDYAFTVSVEVLPEIEPKDFEGLRVERPKVAVEPEEVEQQIKALLESRAEIVPVEDRPSRAGDMVTVEIEAAERDGEFRLEREERTIRLGSDNNLPEFERGLTGLSVGQSFSFEVAYPEDYAGEELRGRTLQFRGEVRQIHETRLPELTDELAREIADVETVDALRERVEEVIRRSKEQEADNAVRRQVLDRLLEANPFEVPSQLVEHELKHRLDELGRRLAMQGVNPDELEIDWEKLIAEERGRAERTVRELLLLDRIAETQGLTIDDDELAEAVGRIAGESGESPEAVRRVLADRSRREGLKKQLLRSKCVDWLVEKAHID